MSNRLCLPVALVVRRRCFEQMSGVVQLVAGFGLFPALVPKPVSQAIRFIGSHGKKIAVLLLRRSEDGDDTVEIGFQRRIRFDHQGIARAFDGFENIGIVERVDALLLAFGQSAGDSKIVDTRGFFDLVEHMADGDAAVGLHAPAPKLIGHFYNNFLFLFLIRV